MKIKDKDKPRFKELLTIQLGIDFSVYDPKIIEFIHDSMFKRRIHSEHSTYFSFHHQEISKAFGRGNFDSINDTINLYDVLPHSHLGKYTRALKPSEALFECFNVVLDAIDLDFCYDVTEAFGKCGAVNRLALSGNRAKFKGKLLQATKVNVKALAEYVKNKKHDTKGRIQGLAILDFARDTTKLPFGWIPSRYNQCSTGRLYSEGANLQNCLKEIRQAALKGQHQLDMSNAHYSLLSQLTDTPTPVTENYQLNKKQIRTSLQLETGLDEVDLKCSLISLIYGARLPSNFRKKNAIAGFCKTQQCYNKLLNNELVRGLHGEVAIAGKELVLANTVKSGRHTGKVKNAMGLICESKSQAKKLSHILQGYEVAILQLIIEEVGVDTSLLLHDGIITHNKHDSTALEAKILDELGLVIKLDYDLI